MVGSDQMETGEAGKCRKGPDVKTSASGQKLSLGSPLVKKNYKNPLNMWNNGSGALDITQ